MNNIENYNMDKEHMGCVKKDDSSFRHNIHTINTSKYFAGADCGNKEFTPTSKPKTGWDSVSVIEVSTDVNLDKFTLYEKANKPQVIQGSATYTATTTDNRVYKRTIPVKATRLSHLETILDEGKEEFKKNLNRILNTLEENLSLLLIRDVDANTITAQLKRLKTGKVYVSITKSITTELQTIAEAVKAAYVELAVQYKM